MSQSTENRLNVMRNAALKLRGPLKDYARGFLDGWAGTSPQSAYVNYPNKYEEGWLEGALLHDGEEKAQ